MMKRLDVDPRYKEIIKLETEKAKFRRKCKNCGWINSILNKSHKVICANCGHTVYLNKNDEFKDKLGRLLKK